MKYIALIFLFFLFNSSKKDENYQSKKKIFKTIELYGGTIEQGSQGCSIDSINMPCSEVKEVLNKYKEQLMKCAPCWLKEYKYSTKKIYREGYAFKIGTDIWHKVYFGVYLEYNDKGDTLVHIKDSTLNLNIIKQLKPDSIWPYLIKNKNFTKPT